MTEQIFGLLELFLYQLLTGKRPFGNGLKDYELIRDEIIEKEPELINIPEKFKNVITACLEKDANKRAKSAYDLLKLLESNVVDEDITVIPGVTNLSHGTTGSPSKPEPKKKLYKYAIVGLIIASLGFGGFKWYQNNKAKELLSQGWDFYKEGKFNEAYNLYSDASNYNSV